MATVAATHLCRRVRCRSSRVPNVPGLAESFAFFLRKGPIPFVLGPQRWLALAAGFSPAREPKAMAIEPAECLPNLLSLVPPIVTQQPSSLPRPRILSSWRMATNCFLSRSPASRARYWPSLAGSGAPRETGADFRWWPGPAQSLRFGITCGCSPCSRQFGELRVVGMAPTGIASSSSQESSGLRRVSTSAAGSSMRKSLGGCGQLTRSYSHHFVITVRASFSRRWAVAPCPCRRLRRAGRYRPRR